ncbi:serine-rich adhesin for platelets-like isoform X1 [Channa argus]|uniref:serine-rich adhesin for platelets-like isoform X1 n=2 Tax=Channa argus TaxID=215402 RepID=UPI0035226202
MMANQPPTDDQIWDYIKKRLSCYTNGSTQQRITTSEDSRDSTLQLSSVAHLPKPVSEEYVERPSLMYSIMEQSSIAERQAAKDVSLSPKTTVASEKQTEYPQIISKVAATCTKNEDESPVVLGAVPPVALDEVTKKYSNKLFNCSSIYEECKTPFSNINQNLDEMDTCKEVTAHSKINSSIQIVNVVSLNANQQLRKKSCEDARKDAGLVHSNRDLFVALSENEQPSKSENKHEQTFLVNNMKDPQYEDISDYEDTSQLLPKLPNSEQEELRVPDVQYEDISEDENPQIENIAVETASLKKLPENNSKRLTFEKEGGRPLECQTNCSSLCSSFSALKNETGDQMDDDWIVLPISISDLKFEEEEEAQNDLGIIVLQAGDTESIKSLGDTSPKEKPASDPGSASVLYQIEEFDTLESFLLSKTAQFRRSSRSSPIKEMDPMTEPHKLQNRRESYSDSEDNCETDDSCNYSPAPEHNYLTVPSHLLKSPTPVPSDKGESAPEKEHEATHPHIGQMRHSEYFKTDKQNISKKDDIIILDSDTEDESDQNSTKTAKRKRESSSSEDREELSCSGQRGHLVKTVDNVGETFKEMLHKNTAQQCQPKLESNIKNISTQNIVIILDSDPEDEGEKNYQKTNCKEVFLSGSEDGGKIRKTEQLTEPKVDSDCIQEAKGQTTSQRAVYHSSDKVGQKDLNQNKKATMDRILSSASDNSGSASFTVQNRHSAETMNSVYRTTSENPQKKTLLFKDSPNKVPQSVGKEADSISDRNTLINPLYVPNESQSGTHLKCAKDSKGTFSKDETQSLKTFTTTSKKTDLLDLNKNDQERCVPKPKSGNKSHCKKKTNILINESKPQARSGSREPLLSNQEGPSTSSCLTSPDKQPFEICRSSASSKDLSLSAESSAFHGLPKSKPCTSDPAYLHSSKLKRSLSYNNTSTLDHTHSPSQGPPSSAPIQLTAKRRAVEDWSNSYVPVGRGRRSSLGTECSRTTSYITNRNARPTSRHSNRAPRQSHKSHKFTTPLMKRAMFEAKQWTKEINRGTSRERRSSVGKGCKWLEKPTLSRPNNRRF